MRGEMMAAPKVFISYSHDAPAHEAKVPALRNRLRGNGIDAILDQYEPFPSGGWIQWMKHQVRDAQFIWWSARKPISGDGTVRKRLVRVLAPNTKASLFSSFFM